jgi:hypothetical protein
VKRHLLIAISLLFTMPALASADPVVKCLQRGLKEAGHNPRGVDGVIGPNTRAAAASWAARLSLDLPDLEPETAPRWCAAVLTTGQKLPEAEAGTELYCAWFGEVLNGVWLDPEGVPVMRFRVASGDDGAGCYAWLNTVKDWQVNETGLQILRVERDAGTWISGDEQNGIVVETGTGSARYIQNGFATPGVLTD